MDILPLKAGKGGALAFLLSALHSKAAAAEDGTLSGEAASAAQAEQRRRDEHSLEPASAEDSLWPELGVQVGARQGG